MRSYNISSVIALALLTLVANGCFLNVDGPQTPAQPVLETSNIVWAKDGSKLFFECDTSMIGHGRWIYVYNNDGTEAGHYLIPDSEYVNYPLCLIEQDSSVLAQNNHQLAQFFYLRNSVTPISVNALTGSILAQSPDHSMLLEWQNGGGGSNTLDLLNINSQGVHVRKEWFEISTGFDFQTAQWLDPATLGYFLSNSNRSVFDFVILDTNLNRVDSFSFAPNLWGYAPNQFRYGPRAFYAESSNGLSKIDSVSHQSTILIPLTSTIVDVAPNGLFLIASISPSPTHIVESDTRIINTTTGAMVQANNLGSAKISPQSDRVASIVGSGLAFTVGVSPISAP